MIRSIYYCLQTKIEFNGKVPGFLITNTRNKRRIAYKWQLNEVPAAKGQMNYKCKFREIKTQLIGVFKFFWCGTFKANNYTFEKPNKNKNFASALQKQRQRMSIDPVTYHGYRNFIQELN